MGTTELHDLPYPEGTAQPFVHLDLKRLADDTDPWLYVECTSTTRPPHRAGRRIFETNTKLSYISDGAVWRQLAPFRVAAGVTVATFAGGVSATASMAFPPDRFTLPPIVTVGVSAGAADVLAFPSNITAANSILVVRTWNGTNKTGPVSVHWHAIQMLPTAAEG